MVDYEQKQPSAFKSDPREGEGVGFVRKDKIDRREILTRYELETIRTMYCPNLLCATDYDKSYIKVNYKYGKAVKVKDYADTLPMIIRSFLSPLPFSKVILIYLRQIIIFIKEIFVGLWRKLEKRIKKG